jgi:hypothetical protein
LASLSACPADFRLRVADWVIKAAPICMPAERCRSRLSLAPRGLVEE